MTFAKIHGAVIDVLSFRLYRIKLLGLCILSFGMLLQNNGYSQSTFTEVSQASGIDYVMNSINLFGGGSAFFDYNNDGNLDLYLTGGNTRDDILFAGDGNGNFTDVTNLAQLAFTSNLVTYGVTTGDVDNDGDRDIFLCTGYGSPSTLLLNNGNGTFTDISNSAGFEDEDRHKHGAVFGDFNLDGFLDIYVTSWVDDFKRIKNAANETIGYAHKCYANLLYVNNGDLTFTESGSKYGVADIGCGLVPAFSDYDNDSDLDAFIVNDFGPWVEPNGLYRNEFPMDTFSNVGVSTNMNQAMYGMGIAIGDYDHDMDLDYYFTSIDSNFLMQNQGNGSFIDLAKTLGVEDDTLPGTSELKTSWGTAFLDVDNDRHQDLFVADGKVGVFLSNANDDPNKLFLNNGQGGFDDISVAAGIDNGHASRSMIYGDYDNDGDLDIFIVIARRDTTFEGHCLLYRNDLSNSNNWLGVNLQGIESNRDGFGAHIEIYVGDDSWLHEVDGGSSYRSQHQTTAHFGLGLAEIVDSLIIIWPGGKHQRLFDIDVNQSILVLEDTSSTDTTIGIASMTSKPALVSVVPNPNTGKFKVQFSPSMVGGEAVIQLFDLQGRSILQETELIQKAEVTEANIKTEGLNTGIYILKVVQNNQVTSTKVLISGQ